MAPGTLRLLGLLLMSLLLACAEDLEVLENDEFEDEFDKKTNWWCASCVAETSTDAYSGLHSALVSERSKVDSFLRQDLSLATNVRYLFQAHVKLVNQIDPEGHTVELLIAYKTDKNYRMTVSVMPSVKTSDMWVHLAGDILIPEGSIKHKVMIRVKDTAEVNFLADKASLVPLLPDADWEETANDRIQENRMGNLQLSVVVPNPYEYEKVRLEIRQTKHSFPFGAAFDARRLYEDKEENPAYRAYFYDLFNWAVFKNDVKWRFMEPSEGDIRTDHILRALDILDEMGIPARGHCVSWGKEVKVPWWLKMKPDGEIRGQVVRRINYLTDIFKGRFAHWDMNNEDLHGRFYEEHTRNPQFLQSMLSEMNAGDPDALLFTNDYEVSERSNFISSYKRQIMTLLADGAPIHGIGIQAHYFDYPDVHLLKHHLDELATTGLPLWISELHYENEDVEVRANGYEDILRMAFSHPAVGGIVQWDFWDESIQYPKASLVDGKDFVENAAGERFRKLVKEEWMSNHVIEPKSFEQNFEMKLFYGDYEVRLMYDEEEMWSYQYNFEPSHDLPHWSVVVGTPFYEINPDAGVVTKKELQKDNVEEMKEVLKQGAEETRKRNDMDDANLLLNWILSEHKLNGA